ncbi:MAG: hypothetical protein K2N48_01670 [Muribaculaceae bacterium]|nr:hypothetical protein [Muribaculaceae bacterium]
MNKGILYFLPVKGDKIVVAEGIFSSETFGLMCDYLREHEYEVPRLWNVWGTGEWYNYDFGYSELFRWEENKYWECLKK